MPQREKSSASKLFQPPARTAAFRSVAVLPRLARIGGGRHLLVGHELDGRLGGDLQHVDAVPSPQGCGAALLQHLLEAADQADLVALGSVHLHNKRDVYRIQCCRVVCIVSVLGKLPTGG